MIKREAFFGCFPILKCRLLPLPGFIISQAAKSITDVLRHNISRPYEHFEDYR